jgi:hypothetical protein
MNIDQETLQQLQGLDPKQLSSLVSEVQNELRSSQGISMNRKQKRMAERMLSKQIKRESLKSSGKK